MAEHRNKQRHKHRGGHARRGAALAALLAAWAQAKLAQHPHGLDWRDGLVLAGLVAAWALGRR